VIARYLNAECDEAGQFCVEDVAGQPIGRNAVAHHAARLRTGVADLDPMPPSRQVVGRRQPARTRSDNQHPLAAGRCRRIEHPTALEGQVAQEPFYAVDRHRAVQFGPIAGVLARVIADPSVNGGQRIVPDKLPPCLLVPLRLRVCQPRLDVLAGRAGHVARWEKVDVDRPALPNRSSASALVQQVRQRRHVRSRAYWAAAVVNHENPSS